MPNLRTLQDEASRLTQSIQELRGATPADEAEAASITDRIDALAKRADEVADQLARENALDAKLAALRSAVLVDPADHLDKIGEKRSERPILASLGGNMSADERMHNVGLWLRGLANGTINRRTLSETGSANTGPEFTGPADFYSSVINVINRKSLAAQLAFVINTTAASVEVPKLATVTADFVAELTPPTPQDPATSRVQIPVWDCKSEVDCSRDLIDDSPVDVASVVTNAMGNAVARHLDVCMFQGHVGKSVSGLVAGIPAGNKVTVASGSTLSAKDVGAMVGAIDPMVNGDFAWFVSGAGWGQLLALEGTRYVQPLVGGGAPVPTVWGVPVFKTDALPTTPNAALAVYCAPRMCTAIAMRKSFEVRVLEELKARENTVVFLGMARFGVANHAPTYASLAIQGTT